VLIGSPTRYGNMTAQMKQLIDSTASLWLKGEMEGKPAGVFTVLRRISWVEGRIFLVQNPSLVAEVEGVLNEKNALVLGV